MSLSVACGVFSLKCACRRMARHIKLGDFYDTVY
jgi:hypothetical protein